MERELRRVAAIVDTAAEHVGDHVHQSPGEVPLTALRRLAEEMTRRQPLLAQAGVPIPNSERAWTWLSGGASPRGGLGPGPKDRVIDYVRLEDKLRYS